MLRAYVPMLGYGVSKPITSYMLLSMNMMSISNFEYEKRKFHDIKMSMIIENYEYDSFYFSF